MEKELKEMDPINMAVGFGLLMANLIVGRNCFRKLKSKTNLFDMSFNRFVYPKVVAVAYGVLAALGVLAVVGLLVWGSMMGISPFGIAIVSVLAIPVCLLWILLWRISCEITVALIKAAENSSQLVEIEKFKLKRSGQMPREQP